MSRSSVHDDPAPDRPGDPAPSVEAYEVDGRTVLQDAENPLAWVEGTNATAVRNRR